MNHPSSRCLAVCAVSSLTKINWAARPRTCASCGPISARGRGKRDDPPMIHYNFKAEDVGVEMSGFRHVGRGKVGDDALDDHVRMLSASAPLHHVFMAVS